MTKRIETLRDFLLRVPILLLPLSLGTVNLGVLWWFSFGAEKLINPAIAPGDALVTLDVAAVACVMLQFTVVAKSCCLGVRATCADYTDNNPPYAAGCMANMALANWAHLRGANTFGAVLWAASLIVMLFGQAIFLISSSRQLLWLPPVQADPSTLQPTVRSPVPTLWSLMTPPAILPFVGISSAAATSGAISWFPTSYWSKAILLYGPEALGGFWTLVLLPIIYAKVARTSLWGQPSSAIIMAPAALQLAGWLTTVDNLDPALLDSWLSHSLAVSVLLLALLPTFAMPRMLGVYPRKSFSPAIVLTVFPTEIVAISLVRYQRVLSQVGAASAGVWHVIAFIAMVLATTTAAIVMSRCIVAAVVVTCD